MLQALLVSIPIIALWLMVEYLLRRLKKLEEMVATYGTPVLYSTRASTIASLLSSPQGNAMASFNRVILLGNLTRDPELRDARGTPVSDVVLAVNERRKVGNEWQDETVFVDCTVWGKTAEFVCDNFSKGDPIFIEGRLQLDQWEHEGHKRSKLKVVVDRAQFAAVKRKDTPQTTDEEKPSW